jgi:hypothetical protein
MEHVVFAPQGFVRFISPAEIVADGMVYRRGRRSGSSATTEEDDPLCEDAETVAPIPGTNPECRLPGGVRSAASVKHPVAKTRWSYRRAVTEANLLRNRGLSLARAGRQPAATGKTRGRNGNSIDRSRIPHLSRPRGERLFGKLIWDSLQRRHAGHRWFTHRPPWRDLLWSHTEG